MNELIKVTTSEGGRQVVSARELYDFLEMDKSQWKRWYAKNIVKNGFAAEKVDWVALDIMSNGNATKDFVITLDFAKRLAMMARSEKGEVVREYFLDCERKAKGELRTADLLNPDFIISLATALKTERAEKVNAQHQVELQKKQLQIAAPKVQYYNEVLQSESLIATTVIAKELGMSAVKLNQLLHHKRIIYKAGDTWVLYDKYQASGYTKPKTITYTSSNGEPKTAIHTYWTEQGRQFIHQVVTA